MNLQLNLPTTKCELTNSQKYATDIIILLLLDAGFLCSILDGNLANTQFELREVQYSVRITPHSLELQIPKSYLGEYFNNLKS